MNALFKILSVDAVTLNLHIHVHTMGFEIICSPFLRQQHAHNRVANTKHVFYLKVVLRKGGNRVRGGGDS